MIWPHILDYIFSLYVVIFCWSNMFTRAFRNVIIIHTLVQLQWNTLYLWINKCFSNPLFFLCQFYILCVPAINLWNSWSSFGRCYCTSRSKCIIFIIACKIWIMRTSIVAKTRNPVCIFFFKFKISLCQRKENTINFFSLTND